MCTLTWQREAAGTYEVFFNRDEKKTRSLAEPPRIHQCDGVSILAPHDPDGGGTWMLANERGVLVCILNRWHEEQGIIDNPTRSRGQLVMEMGALENVPAVDERLRSEDLAGVRPFTMVAFDPVGERGWDWNGQCLVPAELKMPLCSSSFHFEEVAAARRAKFHELACAPATSDNMLEEFHAGSDDGPSAFTVRMCRPDAQTMSRSRVLVGNGAVHWQYWEENPDLGGEPRLYEAALP